MWSFLFYRGWVSGAKALSGSCIIINRSFPIKYDATSGKCGWSSDFDGRETEIEGQRMRKGSSSLYTHTPAPPSHLCTHTPSHHPKHPNLTKTTPIYTNGKRWFQEPPNFTCSRQHYGRHTYDSVDLHRRITSFSMVLTVG